MGWMKTLLLGNLDHQMEIEDAKTQIGVNNLRNDLSARNQQAQTRSVASLSAELGRQKLAITAVTRFLLAKGVISQEELEDFIEEVDAEDGELDGQIPFEMGGRLKLRPGGLPRPK